MVKSLSAKENELKSRGKRAREDEPLVQKEQQTILTEPVSSVSTVVVDSSSSSAKTAVRPKTATLEPLALSEESVRGYFESMGGRMTILALKETFMATIKARNQAHGDKLGSALLLDIVKRLTKTVPDPVLGDMLVLKSMNNT